MAVEQTSHIHSLVLPESLYLEAKIHGDAAGSTVTQFIRSHLKLKRYIDQLRLEAFNRGKPPLRLAVGTEVLTDVDLLMAQYQGSPDHLFTLSLPHTEFEGVKLMAGRTGTDPTKYVRMSMVFGVQIEKMAWAQGGVSINLPISIGETNFLFIY